MIEEKLLSSKACCSALFGVVSRCSTSVSRTSQQFERREVLPYVEKLLDSMASAINQHEEKLRLMVYSVVAKVKLLHLELFAYLLLHARDFCRQRTRSISRVFEAKICGAESWKTMELARNALRDLV